MFTRLRAEYANRAAPSLKPQAFPELEQRNAEWARTLEALGAPVPD